MSEDGGAMKTIRVLSIDFDFFVDCSKILKVDDSSDCAGPAWGSRIAAWTEEGKTLEEEVPFVEDPSFGKFVKLFDFSRSKWLLTHESHRGIVEELSDYGSIDMVNVDAHHDLFYSPLDEGDISKGIYHCGNWGGWLISSRKIRSWTHVYPNWRLGPKAERKGYADLQARKFGVPVKFTWNARWLSGYSPEIVFICQSSPWVPPDYDAKFQELCMLIAERGNFRLPEMHRFCFPREGYSPAALEHQRSRGNKHPSSRSR